jgi:hypothetical protein
MGRDFSYFRWSLDALEAAILDHPPPPGSQRLDGHARPAASSSRTCPAVASESTSTA